MILLSRNFDLSIYSFSDTAKKKNIDNSVRDDTITNNLRLLHDHIIIPILNLLPDYRLYITSGYRSSKLNSYIGGSKTSQHVRGQAADLILLDKHNNNVNHLLFNTIKDNLTYDQLIAERVHKGIPLWVHVSYKNGHNRMQSFNL